MFGEGISKEGDILDLAADLGIVNKSGAWYAYNNAKIGQGRENAKKYLKENPAVCAEIEKKVREHYGLAVEEGTEEPKAEPAQEEPCTWKVKRKLEGKIYARYPNQACDQAEIPYRS